MNQKRMINRAFFLAAMSTVFLSSNLFAADLRAESTNQIVISIKQQQAMGIKIGALTNSVSHVSQRLPGEIVVPVGQERVVSAIQSGLIDSLNVAAGTDVKKGQVLGHITSNEMLTSQRDYLQAATQYRLAKKSFDRDAELFKDGIIAERRYLETKSKLEESTALLSQLRQSLMLGGMNESTIVQLERTGKYASGLYFTSPIDGQVLEQMVTVGQRIDSATPIFKIGRLNPLWLEIHAPVEFGASVSKGMLVRIPHYDASGKIIAIIRNINKNDQTLHMRAEITTNVDKLSPGQFVEVEVVSANDQFSDSKTKQYSLPKNAVIRQGVDNYIFVQSAKGFIPIKVEVHSEQADKVIVTGKSPVDLIGNEQVAIAGTIALKAAWAANLDGGAK